MTTVRVKEARADTLPFKCEEMVKNNTDAKSLQEERNEEEQEKGLTAL